MTSFTNRIKPDSTELERYFLSVYTGNLWDALEKIKDWHSPEHIEKEVQMKLLKLQQQALPVVPEYVAKWYEEHKDDLESSIYRLCIEFNQKVVNTLKTKTKLENWFDYTENKPIETLIRMQEGYTVEKPQLFYLREKNTGYYLRKTGNNIYGITPHYSNDYDEKYMHYKFTQSEIDSMETGSYEQIEVTE